jgi:hypothetical protein
MPTDVYKATALEVQEFINPLQTPGYFMVGSQPRQVPIVIVENQLKNQEARVNSSIPEKWRCMLDRIEGLISVRFAYAGQTKFTPIIKPTSDTQIFKNYPSNFGKGMKVFAAIGCQKPYVSRTNNDALDSETDWTMNSETGEITLATALEKGDHIIMDFDHDSMSECLELKMCVIELASCEMLRGYPTMSENVNDKVSGWETNAQLFLKRLWNGDNSYRTGLQFFDRLKLVGELETRVAGNTRAISPGLGVLM